MSRVSVLRSCVSLSAVSCLVICGLLITLALTMLHSLSILILAFMLAGCALGTPQASPTTQIIIVTPTPPVIPMRETALMRNVQPATNTPDFSYAGLSYIVSNTTTAWFYGEIRNNSQQAQRDIMLRMSLFDQNNTFVVSDTGYLDIGYLKPGEIAPFKVLFNKENASQPFEHIVVEVLSTAINVDDLDSYIYTRSGLALQNSTMHANGIFDVPIVQGTLMNAGNETIKFPKVIITYYDSDGMVVGADIAYAETNANHELAAHHSATFKSGFTVLSGEVSSYRLQIEGLKVR